MAGPRAELAWGWQQLSKSIIMDDPLPALDGDLGAFAKKASSKSSAHPSAVAAQRVHRYLGCDHKMEPIAESSELAKEAPERDGFRSPCTSE